jgi:hypothetical protein
MTLPQSDLARSTTAAPGRARGATNKRRRSRPATARRSSRQLLVLANDNAELPVRKQPANEGLGVLAMEFKDDEACYRWRATRLLPYDVECDDRSRGRRLLRLAEQASDAFGSGALGARLEESSRAVGVQTLATPATRLLTHGLAEVAGDDDGRLVEVAVVGLPARAARLGVDGRRLGQGRRLELGGVVGVDRFCLVRSHRWRTRIASRSRIPVRADRRFPPGRGVRFGSAGPTPARVSGPAGSVGRTAVRMQRDEGVS